MIKTFKFRIPMKDGEAHERVDLITAIAKRDGYITVEEVCGVFEISSYICDEDVIGWDYDVLVDSGVVISPDLYSLTPIVTIMFPRPSLVDPKKRENKKETGIIEFDDVTNPTHYTKGRKYEPRKVIADWKLNFNLGSAVKYIARAGRKDDKIQDLNKAIQYLRFEIEEMGGDQNE